MDGEMLRPKEAARRFSVSRQTLHEWAAAGLIGRSKIGKVVFYAAGDIADLIAAHTTPRSVVPMAAGTTARSADDSWRNDPLWAGTVAAPAAVRDAR